MNAITMTLIVLVASQDVTIEREAPWYWPVGSTYGAKKILQSYGQYQTIKNPVGDAANGFHDGLDIASKPGADVRAPFDCQLVEVLEVTGDWAHYTRVTLAQPGADWALTVTHLTALVYNDSNVGDLINRGALLGKVVPWMDDPADPYDQDFNHVHLGIYTNGGSGPWTLAANHTAANPLAYLGGRSDSRSPFFLPITNAGVGHYPVAFVSDATSSAPAFYPPGSIPAGNVDILARVGDHVYQWSYCWLWSWWSWWWWVTPPLVVSPSRISVRITNAALAEVYENTIEFENGLPGAAYRGPHNVVSGGLAVTSGWPDTDLIFVLTHENADTDAWSALPGDYWVEVTAEDTAGNIHYPPRFKITIN